MAKFRRNHKINGVLFKKGSTFAGDISLRNHLLRKGVLEPGKGNDEELEVATAPAPERVKEK